LKQAHVEKVETVYENIVYVSEFTRYRMYALTMTGVLLDTLQIVMGDLGSASQIAMRPGLFAPPSTIEAPAETTAETGEVVKLPLDLRNDKNDVITTAPFPDPRRITVYAIGEIEINNITVEATFDQHVTVNENSEFHIDTSTPRSCRLVPSSSTSRKTRGSRTGSRIVRSL